MRIGALEVNEEAFRQVCRKWKISRLEIFGSARTGQLRPNSDIDLLVDFEPNEDWSLMDLARAEEDFSSLFGRRADLVVRRSLEKSANWIRREAILSSTEMVYVA